MRLRVRRDTCNTHILGTSRNEHETVEQFAKSYKVVLLIWLNCWPTLYKLSFHKAVIVFSDSGLHSRIYNHPFECGEKPRGDCQSLIGGFSTNEPGICFPQNTGYKIGASGCRQLIVQVCLIICL